jgi:PPOX class probable F420-dependent enzyme
MATFDDFVRLLGDEHGLVVVSTARSDGSVLSSVVNAGVMPHPHSGVPAVAFVSGGSAARLTHLRRRAPVTITARRGWQWASVTGSADLIGPDDPVDGFDHEPIRLLLRAVFQAAGGTHDDWNEYDRVMATERRTAVFVTPGRVLGNA